MKAPRNLYMLCGVPGVGKSSWVNKAALGEDIYMFHLASTDVIIEDIAGRYDITYNDAFRDLIKFAEAQMYRNLKFYVENNLDIIWDQTNLTPAVRASKLTRIPENYHKVAVHFETPPVDILTPRLTSRPGKTIPADVIESMIGKYEPPQVSEGFDEIIVVKSW